MHKICTIEFFQKFIINGYFFRLRLKSQSVPPLMEFNWIILTSELCKNIHYMKMLYSIRNNGNKKSGSWKLKNLMRLDVLQSLTLVTVGYNNKKWCLVVCLFFHRIKFTDKKYPTTKIIASSTVQITQV